MSVEKKLFSVTSTMKNSDQTRMTGIIQVNVLEGIHFADLQDYKGGTIHIRLDENGDVLKAVLELGE